MRGLSGRRCGPTDPRSSARRVKGALGPPVSAPNACEAWSSGPEGHQGPGAARIPRPGCSPHPEARVQPASRGPGAARIPRSGCSPHRVHGVSIRRAAGRFSSNQAGSTPATPLPRAQGQCAGWLPDASCAVPRGGPRRAQLMAVARTTCGDGPGACAFSRGHWRDADSWAGGRRAGTPRAPGLLHRPAMWVALPGLGRVSRPQGAGGSGGEGPGRGVRLGFGGRRLLVGAP